MGALVPASRQARLLHAVLLGLVVLGPVLRADEVKVRGGRFDRKRAVAGRPFRAPEWRVSGDVRWHARAEGDFAVTLAPGASIAREVDVEPLASPDAGRHAIDPAGWRLLLSAELAAAGSGGAAVELHLVSADGTRRLESRRFVVTDPELERVYDGHPAASLGEGRWTLEIRSVGAGAVHVDDPALFRVPAAPAEMRFAKPNGKDGPDRLESGALGFVAWTAHEHAPLPVREVRAESPASEAGLRPGDVIVTLSGVSLPRSSCKPGPAWFEHGHEAMLGRAVEAALATDGRRVRLGVLRGDGRVDLDLTLRARPPLPEGFQFDDEVTPQLYDDLIAFVRRTRREDGHWALGGNAWIQTAFAGLALLGRRDPADARAVCETADWFLGRFPEPESFGNLGFWAAAYSGIFMCEYLLASGDDRVRPWIAAALRWIEAGFHTSKWGMPALGHGPGGLPYGQKALMAPTAHVLVFAALAREAGIPSTVHETAWPYVRHSWSDPESGGHGAMGYNASFRDQGEFWSRTGLVSLALELRGEEQRMRNAMTGVMGRRHAWMRNSHAYGNPGDTWGLVGLATCDRETFATVLRAWRWSFGGAWEPGHGLRHSTAHMGSPYMGGEGLVNPAVATLLSVRHRGLAITGAPRGGRAWLALPPRATPASPVRIGWTPDGRVALRAVVPGLPIVYTLDGSAPTARSERYVGPFALADGGLVRAAVLREGERTGAVSTRALDLPKTTWRILDADGASDPAASRERARALVDGAAWNPWQPDRGQDARGLPLAVTLDLGGVRCFRGVRFRGAQRPSEVNVVFGNAATGMLAEKLVAPVTEGAAASFTLREPVRARYLRVEVLAVPPKARLRFGEMDLLWPEPGVEFAGGALAVEAPAGFTVRWRPAPDEDWRAVEGPIATDRPHRVQLRVFERGGAPVGPVRHAVMPPAEAAGR